MEGETEVLLVLKGEPVAVFGVLAEGQALVRCVGVDEVNGKVLALASDKAVEFRRSLRELWRVQKRKLL